MADIILAKRVVDYVGLGAKGIPESQFRLLKELGLNLSLIQGMSTDGAKLIGVDGSGNLLFMPGLGGGAAAGTPFDAAYLGTNPSAIGAPAIIVGLRKSGGQVTTISDAQSLGDGSQSGHLGVMPYVVGASVNYNRMRETAASILATQSGLGGVVVSGPGQWAANADPGLGVKATATKAAAGAGVRHIVTGFTITISSQAAPAAGLTTIFIRDGASGAGTILQQFSIQLPAALYQPIVITRSGLSLVGSAATAFTIEQGALYAAVGVAIGFEGYDASN